MMAKAEVGMMWEVALYLPEELMLLKTLAEEAFGFEHYPRGHLQ